MDEIILYDPQGNPCAYCEDGEHLWTFDGRPAGYLHEQSIYSYNGAHLGWHFGGWVRDHQGYVAFATNAGKADPGPMRNMLATLPSRGMKQTAPMKQARQTPPHRPNPVVLWSHRLGLFFFSPRSLTPRPEDAPTITREEVTVGELGYELDVDWGALQQAPALELDLSGGPINAPAFAVGNEMELDLGDGEELELDLDR